MIRLVIPSLPPSANNAYFNLPKGGRALTTGAKKYLTETKAYLSQNYRIELASFQPDVPYGLWVRFYFPDLENTTWPKAAKTRYKKFDATNRIKLLEDALKDVAGIDDSQHLVVILQKLQGDTATELFIWRPDKEAAPIVV